MSWKPRDCSMLSHSHTCSQQGAENKGEAYTSGTRGERYHLGPEREREAAACKGAAGGAPGGGRPQILAISRRPVKEEAQSGRHKQQLLGLHRACLHRGRSAGSTPRRPCTHMGFREKPGCTSESSLKSSVTVDEEVCRGSLVSYAMTLHLRTHKVTRSAPAS